MNILIRHEVYYDHAGRAKVTLSQRSIVQRVVADYGDGTCRTSSGDVWAFKRANQEHDGVRVDAVTLARVEG